MEKDILKLSVDGKTLEKVLDKTIKVIDIPI